MAHQVESQTQNTRPKARDKPRYQGSPQQQKQIVLASPAASANNQDDFAKEPRNNLKKQKHLGERKIEDMTAKLSGVYLAPHLRKKGAALEDALKDAPQDVRLGDALGIISSESPPDSSQSQVEKPAKALALP